MEYQFAHYNFDHIFHKLQVTIMTFA